MKKQERKPLPRGSLSQEDLTIYEKATDITVKSVAVGFSDWIETLSPLVRQSNSKEDLFDIYINQA